MGSPVVPVIPASVANPTEAPIWAVAPGMVANNADGLATSATANVQAVGSYGMVWNGAGWDRYGPRAVTAATLTAASAGASSADFVTGGAKGIKLVIDITAITGTTPTLTVTLQGKDAASGKYFTILASAALNAVATTVLTVYPGLTAAANVTASDVLPTTWRVSYAIAGTTPAVTATIGANLIL